MPSIRAYLGAVAVAATMMTTAALADDSRMDDSRRMATLRAAVNACLADRARLCPDVAPGQGRIVACLVGQADQLSPLCAGAMEAASEALMSAGRALQLSPLVKSSLVQ
jgi:cysteine rich repeat protein